MKKLQKQFKEKLQKLKEEQERLKKQQKFTNILPLQSRFLERGPPFSSPFYSSSSFHKSFNPNLKFFFKQSEKTKRIIKKH